MATYGTRKKANAVAVNRYPAAVSQAPAVPGSSPAKVSAKARAIASPPHRTYGRREPQRVRVRSLARPTSGLRKASQALGTNTIAPASAAPTPRVSVRYGSRSRPGRVVNVPVTSDPEA